LVGALYFGGWDVQGSFTMGRPFAAAAMGSYVIQAFVPLLASSTDAKQVPRLRGAVPPQAGSSSGARSALWGVAGIAVMAAAARRPVQTVAKAGDEAALQKVEELPPRQEDDDLPIRQRPKPPEPIKKMKPFNPALQYGATAPLGFFDPLGFSKVGDMEGFRRLRISELKHGRVAMMACAGVIMQHYQVWVSWENVPRGIYAVTNWKGAVGFTLIVIWCAAAELKFWKDKLRRVEDVGDYGNPFQTTFLADGDAWLGDADWKNKELNNGRAAMIAISGIIAAELVTGKDGMMQLGLK